MRNAAFIDETELREAIMAINRPGDIFEVRVIRSVKSKKPICGYFRTADKLIEKLDTVDLRGANVYITLGAIKESCFARIQSEHLMEGVQTTSDNDIDGYRWLFIDLDPVRTSGVSSSDEEKRSAFRLAGRVARYMEDIGFEKPIYADSGNGCHLLYAVSLPNNEENRRLIEKCLKVLDMLFSTDDVKVDTANFNPARICKLYGTMAQKGTSTADRPHRMSHMMTHGPVKVTPKAYVQKLADQVEIKPEAPQRYNSYNPGGFDIVNWMDSHGISYKPDEGKDGIEKFVLDKCPFNPDHTAPDSMIFRQRSGAIGFKCLHNSCSCKTWHDVRVMFEPDAYSHEDDDARIEAGWHSHNRDKARLIQQMKAKKEEQDPKRAFLTAREINALPEPSPEYIRTGVYDIDRLCGGLGKGQLSVMSGLRSSGKSTLLGQVMLEAIQDGHSVICYSGELPKKRFMRWLYLQAAGKVETIQRGINDFDIKPEIKARIADWMDKNFHLYDNDYGNDINRILPLLRAQITASGADLVILDNLMTVDLGEEEQYDKYRAQKIFMQQIIEIAHTYNVHVVLVAHPRKATSFLRLEDISGTADIVNLADNAFIIHRVNTDFKLRYMETFKIKKGQEPDFFEASNVIEIAKDREHGTQDVFASLYFEKSTKRLRNTLDENRVYGWQSDDFAAAGSTPFEVTR